MNVADLKIKNVLNRYIPLYIGMPVVLRLKNISTDLKVMNGS